MVTYRIQEYLLIHQRSKPGGGIINHPAILHYNSTLGVSLNMTCLLIGSAASLKELRDIKGQLASLLDCLDSSVSLLRSL